MLPQFKKIEWSKMLSQAEEHRLAGRIKDCTDLLAFVAREQEDYSRNMSRRHFSWVTVNCMPGIEADSMRVLCEKLTHKAFVDRYWYSFEQRGEDNHSYGKGMHVHFILIPKCGDRHVTRQVRSHFSNMVLIPAQHIDVRSYPLSFLQDKIAYIKGDKWDPDKYVKVCMDRQWRKDKNLQPYYTNAGSPSDMGEETSEGSSEVREVESST